VIRLLRLLAVRPARHRPLRALLAVVAVAAGASMAVSVFIVRSSVGHSVESFGEELSGPTELRVVGATRRGGLEADVLDRVEATNGVEAAVPVVQALATVDMTTAPSTRGAQTIEANRVVLALGVDCRAEALAGPFGCTGELVADHGDRPLALGPGIDGGELLADGTLVDLNGTPTFDRLDGLGAGNFVVFPLPAAQRLFNRIDRLDAIYVRPGPGVDVGELQDRLEQVVGEQNGVLRAADGPPEVELAVSSVLPLFTLLALFALGTGAMLVHNTVTLTLEERRRELAVLGALGGTPATVRRTVLGEAALIGALGGGLGAAGGVVVARPIVATLSGYTERTSGVPVELHLGPGPLVVGATLGMVMALAAAWVPVRRALRVDVAGELSGRGRRAEAAAPRLLRRSIGCALLASAGLGCIVVGRRDDGLETWQPNLAGFGFALTAMGLLLLGASVAPLLIRPLARLRLVDSSPVGRLAVANLLRSPGRTGVMVAALIAASTTAFVTAGYTNGLRAAFTDDLDDDVGSVEVSVVDAGVNVNLDVGLSPDLAQTLREVPGVADVRMSASLLAGTRPADLMSVVAFDERWLDGRDGEEAVRGTYDADAFERGEALINTTLARDTGLRPGDDIQLPTASGMVAVPVQAVVPGGGGPTGRTVLLPWDLHRQLYGRQPVRSLAVEPGPGVTPGELAERIWASELVGAGQPGFVRLPSDLAAAVNRSVEGQMDAFWAFQRGLLAVSFVAVLSTLLLVGAQRRREMAMLAAVGSPPSTLFRMVLAEAGIVGVVAVALSAAGGMVMLWALVEVSPLVVGFSTPYRPDWVSIPSSGGLALVVALLAACWPARRAARTDVAVALRYE
jgi:putative ABC transport system permease protein